MVEKLRMPQGEVGANVLSKFSDVGCSLNWSYTQLGLTCFIAVVYNQAASFAFHSGGFRQNIRLNCRDLEITI